MNNISDFKNVFFIGIAGVGMSAIAQYLKADGVEISGSDRYFLPNEPNRTKTQLEAEGIHCYAQDGSGIGSHTDLVVVSTAIEDTVFEVKKAKELGIPIMKRSALLALISKSKKTIAIAGTSGKSTTSAMLFQILDDAGLSPSIISGAGLTSLIKQGKIGNAAHGSGDWLIIEADESDGSVVQYEPEIGVLLNIDKDHQEIDELIPLFKTFKSHTQSVFIVNQSNDYTKQLSQSIEQDFGYGVAAGTRADHFNQKAFKLNFRVDNQLFEMTALGKHSVENATAAIAVAKRLGVSLSTCAKSLSEYEGIYRRHQILGIKNQVCVIDDYAHNPAKCATSIRACQALSDKVVAWFQPHGYGPTRFLRSDFVEEFSNVLRPNDELWMSEIFYAGGSTVKNISANDLIQDIIKNGKNAYFVENRNRFLAKVRPSLTPNSVLLLMGARDPSLEVFAQQVFEEL